LVKGAIEHGSLAEGINRRCLKSPAGTDIADGIGIVTINPPNGCGAGAGWGAEAEFLAGLERVVSVDPILDGGVFGFLITCYHGGDCTDGVEVFNFDGCFGDWGPASADGDAHASCGKKGEGGKGGHHDRCRGSANAGKLHMSATPSISVIQVITGGTVELGREFLQGWEKTPDQFIGQLD
jgi:hypothetical protein